MWLGLEWGPLGGVRARRAALWVQMQRAAHQQGVLPAKAQQRLEIMGMGWESMVCAPGPLTTQINCGDVVKNVEGWKFVRVLMPAEVILSARRSRARAGSPW